MIGPQPARASSRGLSESKSLPSSISRLAPPPVEMWVSASAMPATYTAAAVSPPPAMVMQPALVAAATALAMAIVP